MTNSLLTIIAIKNLEEDRKPLAWKCQWLHDYDTRKKICICRKKEVIPQLSHRSRLFDSKIVQKFRGDSADCFYDNYWITGTTELMQFPCSRVLRFPSLRAVECIEAYWQATAKLTTRIYQRSMESLLHVSQSQSLSLLVLLAMIQKCTVLC